MKKSRPEKTTGAAVVSRIEGIDLLRILCMFMITVLHTLGQGGAMVRISTMPATYNAAWLLETAAMCSVNAYGLISGYVGVKSPPRAARYLELWLTVFFYSAGITAVMSLVHPGALNTEYLQKALLPVCFKAYWYFSAYTGVFFLAPYLTKMVRALDEAMRRRLLLVLFLVFTVLPAVPKGFSSDFFSLGGGYTFVWLLLLYIAGACLRDLPMKLRKRGTWLWVYLFCVLFSWGYKCLMEEYTRQTLGKAMYGRIFVAFTSPTMVLAAAALVLYFGSFPSLKRTVSSAVKFLSPMAFPVYLIHVHPMVWDLLMKDAAAQLRYLSPVMLIVRVLAAAACIFALCICADCLRRGIFELLNVRKFCGNVCDAVWKRLPDNLKSTQQ